jgi:hypothetical protein
MDGASLLPSGGAAILLVLGPPTALNRNGVVCCRFVFLPKPGLAASLEWTVLEYHRGLEIEAWLPHKGNGGQKLAGSKNGMAPSGRGQPAPTRQRRCS